MPFKSVAQQKFMESKSSPLSAGQKKEWEGATNFKNLPAKVASKFQGRKKKKK